MLAAAVKRVLLLAWFYYFLRPFLSRLLWSIKNKSLETMRLTLALTRTIGDLATAFPWGYLLILRKAVRRNFKRQELGLMIEVYKKVVEWLLELSLGPSNGDYIDGSSGSGAGMIFFFWNQFFSCSHSNEASTRQSRLLWRFPVGDWPSPQQ